MIGAKHAVAVCNATTALHLAMIVAGIGQGDRVVTSPITFLASANCAAYVGAMPDFADIEMVSYTMDPEALASTWKRDTKAVVAVAYAGQSADMPKIAHIARANGAVVIEDACHGPGGGFSYEDRHWKLGAHPWADISIFSFHPVKTMTTGEGGMLVTDDEDYAQRARRLRSHGIERNQESFTTFSDGDSNSILSKGSWIYEMQELGFNYRITDFQCALGRSQLERLSRFVDRRKSIVSRYNRELRNIPYITTPSTRCVEDSGLVSWHLYTLLIDFHQIGKSRQEVMHQLRARGVGSQVLYIPVYLQPYYQQQYGYQVGMCPNAEEFYKKALSIPLAPAMTDDDIGHVIRCVNDVITPSE